MQLGMCVVIMNIYIYIYFYGDSKSHSEVSPTSTN